MRFPLAIDTVCLRCRGTFPRRTTIWGENNWINIHSTGNGPVDCPKAKRYERYRLGRLFIFPFRPSLGRLLLQRRHLRRRLLIPVRQSFRVVALSALLCPGNVGGRRIPRRVQPGDLWLSVCVFPDPFDRGKRQDKRYCPKTPASSEERDRTTAVITVSSVKRRGEHVVTLRSTGDSR